MRERNLMTLEQIKTKKCPLGTLPDGKCIGTDCAWFRLAGPAVPCTGYCSPTYTPEPDRFTLDEQVEQI